MQIEQTVELCVSRAAHVVMKEENDLVLGSDVKAGLIEYRQTG